MEKKNEQCLKLNVYGRIKIGELFPEKANLEDGIVIKDIRNKVAFTQDELKEFEIKTTVTNQDVPITKWNKKGAEGKVIELTVLEITFLQKQVKRLDNKGEILTEDSFIELCKQILNLIV